MSARRAGAVVGLVLVMAVSGAAQAAPEASSGEVGGTWTCGDGIVLTSHKDISNVVLVVDGEHVRHYEHEEGDPALTRLVIDPLVVDGTITGAFVKAGRNGAGPGGRGLGEPVPLTDPMCFATGDVQATLRWASDDDLDLEVTDPAGDTVAYYNRTVPSGGALDLDDNVAVCGTQQPPAAENITWPEDGAPSGAYVVRVREFDLCDGVTSPAWHLVVRVDGVVVVDERGTGEFEVGVSVP